MSRDTPTPGVLVTEFRRLSQKAEDALDGLFAASVDYSTNENAYRMKRARLQLEAGEKLEEQGIKKPNVDEKAAYVDLQTGPERTAAHHSEAIMLAHRKSVDVRQAQLSALQSIAKIIMAELHQSGRT